MQKIAIAVTCFYFLGLSASLVLADTPAPAVPTTNACRIEVVEKGSGWPVPGMILTAVHGEQFVTDNAGVVAYDVPEGMNRETWFSVSGDGYEMPLDGFGNRGFRFVPKAGETYRVEVYRNNIAKRLGRLTGSGIFSESQKLGDRLDWKESGVTGQDTVEIATYGGKLHWAWGDTDIFNYPLGFFNTGGATTSLMPLTSFEPPIALKYDYYCGDNGIPHGIVGIKSDGPIWLTAFTTLLDKYGKEHLISSYVKIANHLDVVAAGLAEWDPVTSTFQEVKTLWSREQGGQQPIMPGGHPAFWTDDSGKKWVYFGEGLPGLRCPATYEAWKDPSTWEKVDKPDSLTSASGEKITIASGSIAWQPVRKKWVTVFEQKYGKPSLLGEIWYAEADTPTGPWGRAVKIVSHNQYTFYNPLLHPELAPADANFILFEGTYTAEFSNGASPTPRYNYNQILYRLDLDDPALKPAQSPALAFVFPNGCSPARMAATSTSSARR
jgi:hypothetical protein